MALERQGWILAMPRDERNHCCVAVRAHIIGNNPANLTIVHEGYQGRGVDSLMVRVALERPLAGLTSLTVGSFRVDEAFVTRPIFSRAAMSAMFAKAVQHQTDVMGFDSSGAIGALMNATRTVPGPEGRGLVMLATPPDFVGLVLPKGSQLLDMRLHRVRSYMPAPGDLGLGVGDTSGHALVLAHWVPPTTAVGARQRNVLRLAERKDRQKRARAERDAASASSAATPQPGGTT